jgi:hypothetical protein
MYSAIAVTCVLATMGGCTQSVLTSRFDDSVADRPHAAVVAYLPRTKLKLTIIYTVARNVTRVSGHVTNVTDGTCTIDKPVVATPIIVPDPATRMTISGKEISDSIWLDATSEIKVHDSMLLESVSADTEDKGPAVAKSLISTAASIAKLAIPKGVRPAEPDPVVRNLRARIGKIDAAIENLANTPDLPLNEDNTKKLAVLLEERKVLLETIDARKGTDGISSESEDITHEVEIDLALGDGKFTNPPGKDYLEHTYKPAKPLASDVPLEDMPALIIRLSDPKKVLSANASDPVFKDGSTIQGVPHRPPLLTQMKLAVKSGGTEVEILDGMIPVCQFGKVSIADAQSKLWGTRNTAITFSESTGGVSSYKIVSTSSAANAADVANVAAETAQATIQEFRDAQKSDLARKTSAAEERTNYYNALIAQEEARKKWEESQKPTTKRR